MNKFTLILTTSLAFFTPSLVAQSTEKTVTIVAQNDHNSQDLVYQAKELYRQQKYTEAAALLEQAIDNFGTKNDPLSQAATLSNLALVYQQLGQFSLAENTIDRSLNLLNNLPDSFAKNKTLAGSLTISGKLLQDTGKIEMAIENWEKAESIYNKLKDRHGVVKTQINQAQALQDLGFYPKSCKILLKALNLAHKECQISLEEIENISSQTDLKLKSTVLLSLGKTLRTIGNLELSEKILQQSLSLEQESINSEKSPIFLALANTQVALAKRAFEIEEIEEVKNYRDQAITNYQKAIETTKSSLIKSQAQLNIFSLLLINGFWEQASKLLPEIDESLSKLPASRTTIFAKINYAQSLICLGSKNKECQPNNNINEIKKAQKILENAIIEAQNIKDVRAESLALGNLGELNLKLNNSQEAIKNFQQALTLAQSIKAEDIAYRWYWQLGKIFKENKPEIAQKYYDQAFTMLKNLRGDLVILNPEVQFSFRETVEPVYREYADLLLFSETPTQVQLNKARQVIESLQLAELNNFFRNACLDAKPVNIDNLDPKAAIFYTIILEDRLEVILAIPNQPLISYKTKIPAQELKTKLGDTRFNISGEEIRGISVEPTNPEDVQKSLLPKLEEAYNWLIKPAAETLKNNQIETLVFVQDGILKNFPISAVYNGNKYLIEEYRVALAPSLELIDPNPLNLEQIAMFSGGISDAVQGFSALPGVEIELQTIQKKIPTEPILNKQFIESKIEQEVKNNPYQIIHLATHGLFSRDVENTFILTYDDRININELNTLLRKQQKGDRPIELLVLSACQTAVGDEKAALGLAGVAVKAGTRSTIASLWSVSDEATVLLMSTFYQELAQGNITKSEAFRRAQLAVLNNAEFSDPYFWSAFVLLGNWL